MGKPRTKKSKSKEKAVALAEAEAQLLAVQEELEQTDKLTTAQLECYLWAAADVLRGQIDSSDYKNYIFGLLFLKRISDVFVEEAEKLIAEGLPEKVAWSDPDEHQVFVPERARWSSIQRKATNIGEAINTACSALEEYNSSSLEGVLAGIDFNDECRLGNAKNRDAILSRLVQHFGKLSLKNADLSEPDMLGRAYEYLIERFADDAGKEGGEFYTPRKVVQLIVEILAPEEGMRICDPTCGSGGMLIDCAPAGERAAGARMGEDEILTLKEVADYLKLTERTLYRLTEEGKLPGFKVGNSWRFRLRDIDDLDRAPEGRGASRRGATVIHRDDPAALASFTLAAREHARGSGSAWAR